MLIVETLRRNSPRQLYLAHKAKGHVQDVIATIDIDAFLTLRKTARESSKTLNALKYFNLHGYINEQMKRALSLRLNNAAKTVLDIGTGFGYFPYICEFFGNSAVAIDVPDHILFNKVTQFLKVKKIHHRIEPFQPLPNFDQKFDLVTAFQVAFNWYDRTKPWQEKEWSFFLEDIFTNILKENGEIAFEMNYDPVYRNWLSEGARRALKQYRLQTFGAMVHAKR